MTEEFSFGHQDINAPPLSPAMNSRSDLLRAWYRTGQRLFRYVNQQLDCIQKMDGTRLVKLNDHVQDLDGVALEGFLMGWQSDQYAYDNGMELAVEGMDQVLTENFYGPLEQVEGDTVLAGSSQD